MTNDPADLVRVAVGNLVQIEAYQHALRDAGIESQVVGDELGTGLGTALPQSIELWVHRLYTDRAEKAIELLESGRGKEPHEHQIHEHPKSDQKPNRPTVHGPHTHYNPDPRN